MKKSHNTITPQKRQSKQLCNINYKNLKHTHGQDIIKDEMPYSLYNNNITHENDNNDNTEIQKYQRCTIVLI